MGEEIVKLKEWYEHECEDVSKKVGKYKRALFRLIKIYLWIVGISGGLFLLFIAFGVAIVGFHSSLSTVLLYYSLLVCSFLATIALIYIFAQAKFATIEVLERKGSVIPFLDENFPGITEDIMELMDKVGIDRSRLVIWQFLSTNTYPSIEEGKDMQIHLILPLNFILLHQSDPAEFKAIITHELAHVNQKDTDIYQVCDTYYSIMQTLFVPNAVFNIICCVYALLKASNSETELPMPIYFGLAILAILSLMLILFFDDNVKKVKQAREKSELLADTFSYIHFGEKILQLLKKNSDKGIKSNSYHPSPEKRYNNLVETLTTYNHTT